MSAGRTYSTILWERAVRPWMLEWTSHTASVRRYSILSNTSACENGRRGRTCSKVLTSRTPTPVGSSLIAGLDPPGLLWRLLLVTSDGKDSHRFADAFALYNGHSTLYDWERRVQRSLLRSLSEAMNIDGYLT